LSELILYTTEDGRSQIKLRADQQTVWLTQLEMAELFDATKQNISLHLKNIFQDGELDPAATVKESLTVQTEGARSVQRPVTHPSRRRRRRSPSLRPRCATGPCRGLSCR
jgi:hypothetical protein